MGRSIVNFETALSALKKGSRVSKEGWLERNGFLKLQTPDEYSLMTVPYIYLSDGVNQVPWMPSYKELLAEDWIILD